MAFREDWTRITHSIHSLISAFSTSHSRDSGKTGKTIVNSPRVRRTATMMRPAMNPRFLAEIERRRYQVYMSRLRNQIK